MRHVILIYFLLSIKFSVAQFTFPVTSYTVGYPSKNLTTADFNTDGKLDVLVIEPGDPMIILYGNGIGGLGPAMITYTSSPSIWEHPVHADFNNDNKEDVAVFTTPAPSYVRVLLGDGLGSFSLNSDFSVGNRPVDMTIADFNADGLKDIATANDSSQNISVLIGTGNGSFATVVNYTVNGLPTSITYGDFNNDGNTDLAANVSGNVSILLGTGTGSFGAPIDFPSVANPAVIAAKDLNNDGLDDIATADKNGSTLSILLSNGSGGFSSSTSFACGANPYALVSEDFNTDGLPDLAISNHWAGNITLLYGTGNGNFGSPTNIPIPGASTWGMVSGDFNIDGSPDLAAIDYTGGNSVYLLLCSVNTAILGTTFQDNNSDCQHNAGDAGLKNIPAKLFNSSGNLLGKTFTQSNGSYAFALPVSTYTVVIDTAGLPFETQCIYPGLDTTVAVSGLDSNINFSLKCKNGFDAGVQSVVANGLVFPGQQHTLNFVIGDMSQKYNLNCIAGISGQVQITINGPVSYIGPAPGSYTPVVVGNVFTYTIADFGLVNNSNAFKLILLTDTTAQAGNTICVTINVNPTLGDINIVNNTFNYCYSVVNSLDPNFKEVYPLDVAPGYTDWFTYTVHFQNTGNAPAINIRVTDMLDSNLDVSTFDFLTSSHYSTVSLNGNFLTVKFPNIFLPDSLSNPAGSMGYFQYRVKPKATWPSNTPIENTAYIYFDYNPPVITNTSINSIITGIQTFTSAKNKIYPNPSSTVIYTDNVSASGYKITNSLGQTCAEGKITTEINISSLSSGVYFLYTYNKEGQFFVNKFIKQ